MRSERDCQNGCQQDEDPVHGRDKMMCDESIKAGCAVTGAAFPKRCCRTALDMASAGRKDFCDSLDGSGFAGGFVDLDHGAVEFDGAFGDGVDNGAAGEEALDDGLDLAAEAGLGGAAHPGVAEEGGAVGEDLFVGGLRVSVRADD